MANWIHEAISRPGSLHAALHVPQGQKIPGTKMKKALGSSNPTLRKKAILARTLGRFKK